MRHWILILFALITLGGPRVRETTAPAYDAGSEVNNELSTRSVGPRTSGRSRRGRYLAFRTSSAAALLPVVA